MTIEINADTVSARNSMEEISLHWSSIKLVQFTDKYLFLYWKPADAFIVPRRALDSDAEFRQFCDDCLQNWNAAKWALLQSGPNVKSRAGNQC